MEKLGGEDGCYFDGVSSVVEAALVLWGFTCMGSLSLGGGQRLPLAPPPSTAAAGRGCWRIPWCESIPIWGALLSGRAGWCTQSEWGNFGMGLDAG